MDSKGGSQGGELSPPIRAQRFHRAIKLADLDDQMPVALTVGERYLLVCRVDTELYATDNRCPHANAALATGRVRHGKIICPLHGARFDLATGNCIGAAYAPLNIFQTRVRDEFVEIALPD